MSVKNKYQEVLAIGESFNVKDGYVNEENNILKIGGTTQTQYQKNKMWDKIKEIGGENPDDVEADIKVTDTSAYHYHTVEKGETLGAISKHYYDDASQYSKIFQANTDKLKSADLIHPGQVLTIPFK